MPRQNSSSWSASDQISATRLNDFNQDIDDLYGTGSDRLKVWHVTGLDVEVGAGNFRVGSSEGIYAGEVVTLADNTDSYIMITGGGVLDISVVGWDTNYLRLAKVTTLAGTVTTIETWRPDGVGGVLGGGGFKNTSSFVYSNGLLTSFVGDGVTFTLTYSNGRLATITNGVLTWTMTYDGLGNLTGTVES